MADSQSVPAASNDDTLREVDRVLRELGKLAKSNREADDFFAILLEHTALLMDAEGAAVWVNAPGGAHLACQKGLADLVASVTRRDFRHHASVVHELNGQAGSQYLSLSESAIGHSVVLAPIAWGEKSWGTLAIYHDRELPEVVRDGYLRLVEAVAEIAVDYQREHRLRSHASQLEVWHRYRSFSVGAHQHDGLVDVAQVLANEGRALMGSDRVSVARLYGGRGRIVSISGMETVNRKSPLVQKLESLVDAVMRTREPLIFRGDLSGLPPQIDGPLQRYLDESATRQLAVLPLNEKANAPLAALVVEDFGGRPLDDWLQRLAKFSEHASIAMGRACGTGVVARLGSWASGIAFRRAVTLLICASVLVGVGWLMSQVQRDFHVTVRGELQPVTRKNVFAAIDGHVRDLHVVHGQSVAAGNPLATLASPQLDLESKRLFGEIQTARQQLAAIDAERLQLGQRFDPESMRLSSKYTSEQQALQKRIENLLEQEKILVEMRADLNVSSPIAGTVMNWDVEQSLTSRPVRRGQPLFSIADLKGEWRVRLNVPDNDMGHILESDPLQNPLNVQFVLATNPEVKHDGKTARLGTVSTPDDEGTPSVLVEVDFDESLVEELRPGAEVVGTVDCGRRPIGYIWLRPIIRELQRRGYLAGFEELPGWKSQ